MKLDGSNLSEAQKQNLRTILGSDGKNLGNSDLSLEQNRSLNLGSYFLNFFSNVGAKIGINKVNPTQALDVVGNIKSDAIILNDLGTSEYLGTVKRAGNEIKFKTSSGWETIMLKGDYVSDSHGIISPDSQEPVDGWKIGWYTPKEKSSYPGTNYPNQNDLKVIEGFFCEFYFDGNIWESVDVKMPSNEVSGSVGNFSTAIPFNQYLVQMVKQVDGPLKLTIDPNSPQIGFGCCVKFISDGINTPDISEFKKMSGSQDYINEMGVANFMYFFFLAGIYWVNVWQEGDGLGVVTPTYQTVNFNDLHGASLDNVTKILSGNVNSGANLTNGLNPSNNFQLILETSSDSAVLGLTSALSNLFGWTGPGVQQDYIVCIYKYQGMVYVAKAVNNIIENIGQGNSLGNYMRIKKSGNDAICSTSADGLIWTDFQTASGVFSGITNTYVKGMFAFGNGLSLKAKFKN